MADSHDVPQGLLDFIEHCDAFLSYAESVGPEGTGAIVLVFKDAETAPECIGAFASADLVEIPAALRSALECAGDKESLEHGRMIREVMSADDTGRPN